MNILQIMGCTSDQYASLEHYLVRKARICRERGYNFFVAYNNIPVSQKFIADLTAEGASLFKLEAKYLFDFNFYTKIRKTLIEHNINVIHAYFAPTRHYAIIAAGLFGVKKRFRQGANLPLSRQNRDNIAFTLFKLKHRLLSFFATKYICRSNAVKNEYLKIGINPSKLSVADGGTDTDTYKKIEDISAKDVLGFAIEPDTVIIGTASRLVKEKGIDTILKAVKILRDKQKVILLILGEGPERGKLEQFAKELEIDNQVKFLGHRENLEIYYNIMDIFISASHSEGMSNSVLEAMSCELPVILSDIEPNKEIINTAMNKNLYAGELFPAGDAASLAERISIIIKNNSLAKMGEDARKIIIYNYSIDERIRKEFAIYEDCD